MGRMTREGKEKPTSRNKAEAGRIDRLAEALRANLRRRKAQARGRAGGSEDPNRNTKGPGQPKD